MIHFKNIFLLILFFSSLVRGVYAQSQEWPSPEIENMYNQGMANLSRGNATDAVAILQRTLQAAPGMIVVKRSLAMAYQLSGDNKLAIKTLDPLFDGDKADDQCYKVAAAAWMAEGEAGKARKILNSGIDRFPGSGMLYHELGLIYEGEENYEEALKTWLEGIKNDRNYHLNYYEAAMAYMRTDNAIWPIIYGEIFINKEHNTRRADETRIMLLDAYKKLFFTPLKNGEELSGKKNANPRTFDEAVLQTFQKLFYVVSDGITSENLVMLRTRFVIEWTTSYASQYPFALFSYHEELINNGHFDAYNQWLFGKAENAQQYSSWADMFKSDIKTMEQYLDAHPLAIAPTDNYNKQRNFRNSFSRSDKKTGKR